MTSNELFGSFIREKRLEKGYTARKFCEMLDVSQTFLSRMERNEIPAPGEEKIVAMAQVLSMDSEKLIFMAKKMPKAIKKLIIDRPDISPLIKIASTKTPEEINKIVMMMLN